MPKAILAVSGRGKSETSDHSSFCGHEGTLLAFALHINTSFHFNIGEMIYDNHSLVNRPNVCS